MRTRGRNAGTQDRRNGTAPGGAGLHLLCCGRGGRALVGVLRCAGRRRWRSRNRCRFPNRRLASSRSAILSCLLQSRCPRNRCAPRRAPSARRPHGRATRRGRRNRPNPTCRPTRGSPPEDPAKPPTTLQTTPTQQEGEQERRIRARLSQAASSLNRINYQALNTDGRMQYDTTKRLINQAEEAVRAKNLVFASSVADKAAALAAELSGR